MPGPLDHPRLLEIEETLDRAEIDAAQRLLAELGDLQVHRTAITYFATRLLYQRGRLDVAGVIERMRELLVMEPDFPQASAMLLAAEQGTLRPDQAGFLRATSIAPRSSGAREAWDTTPSADPPSSVRGSKAALRKDSSAPTLELAEDDSLTDPFELTLEEPAAVRKREREPEPSLPTIPRAPMLPKFTPAPHARPSYVPQPYAGPDDEGVGLELDLAALTASRPSSSRDTEQHELDPPSAPMLAAPVSAAAVSPGRYTLDHPKLEDEQIEIVAPKLPRPNTADTVSSDLADEQEPSLIGIVAELDAGNIAAALAALERSPRANTPEFALLRARCLWQSHDRSGALAVIERLEHAPLLEPDIRAGVGRFLIEGGEPERGLVQARRAHHDEPSAPLSRLVLVWALVRAARRAPNQQLLDEAEQLLAKLRAHLAPIPALVQALRAAVLAEKGDPERAVTTAQLALGLDAHSIDALAALSIASARLGHVEDAQIAWQRLREESASEADYLCDRLEQLGVSVRQLSVGRATARDSSAVRLWDKSEIELFSGDHERAIAAFQRDAARELEGLVGDNATDAIPLLATMAASFFTTSPVWRHFAPYDLSVHSLERFAAALDVLYGSEARGPLSDEAHPSLVLLATYAGESLRQAHRGSWRGSLAEPDRVLVEARGVRFAPFAELRARLERGTRPAFFSRKALPQHGEAERRISIPSAPPTPWAPADWPSARMLPRLALGVAQSVVELYCAEFGGGVLDRSRRSLASLERYVALLAPPGAPVPHDQRWARRAAILVGSYVGEVICEALGGRWREILGPVQGPESYVVLLSGGGATHPVAHAFDRLTGKHHEPLPDYLERIESESRR